MSRALATANARTIAGRGADASCSETTDYHYEQPSTTSLVWLMVSLTLMQLHARNGDSLFHASFSSSLVSADVSISP
jgi:hypothetical protein